MLSTVRQVVGQSEEDGAAGFGAQLFDAAARVPERQRKQTAPPAGRRLHLHIAQIAVHLPVLLPGPSQSLPLCPGTHNLSVSVSVSVSFTHTHAHMKIYSYETLVL